MGFLFDEPPENLDDAKLVTVFECPDEPGAALRVHVLADAGIRAVSMGGLTAGLGADTAGWVLVKVLERDEAHAKRVLSEVQRIEPDDDGYDDVDEDRGFDATDTD